MSQTYAQLIAAQGATYHLPYENNLNTTIAQATHATSGTATFTTSPKRYGAYARTVANGTTASAGYAASTYLTKFAASFWVYFTAAPGTYQFAVMPCTSISDTLYYSGVVIGGDRKIEYYTRHYNSSSYDQTIYSVNAIPLTTWTHVCVTYDQSTGYKAIYLNGTLDNSVTLPTNQRASLQKFIKTTHSGANNTILDSMSLWGNVTLPTPSQIKQQATFHERTVKYFDLASGTWKDTVAERVFKDGEWQTWNATRWNGSAWVPA